MAFDLFKLSGSIFVDTTDASNSIHKTDEEASSLGDTLSAVGNVALKCAEYVVDFGIKAGEAIWEATKDTAETSDNIDKLSQRLGLGREAFQELDYVLSQNGVDINSFQTGMKALLQNMDKVTEGNKTAIENFDLLNVSVQNADGSLRSQEEVLWDVIDAFQNMEDSAEKSRLAQELFGRQGQEITPMLNAQAGSLEEMRNQAHEYGLILSDEVIDAGVEFTDLMDTFERQTDMIKTSIGGAVLPIVNQLLSFIVEQMPLVQQAFETFNPIITDFFDQLMPTIRDLIEQLLPMFQDMSDQLVPLYQQLSAEILPIIAGLLERLIPFMVEVAVQLLPAYLEVMIALMPLIEGLIPLLDPIIECTLELIPPITKILTELLPPLIQIITVLTADIIVPLINLIMGELAHTLNFLIALVVDDVMPSITNLLDAFKGLLDFIVGVFTLDFKRAWNGIKDFILGIFKAIGNSLINTVNGIIDTINFLVREVSRQLSQIPSNIPIIGGLSFTAPQIPRVPMLEMGGTITDAGSVLVGEKAPEILDLPRGARVTPLDKVSNGLSKNDMKEAMIEALQSVGIQLELSTNSDALFDKVVKQNTEYRRRHNGASALA